jgi:hypothetical protein
MMRMRPAVVGGLLLAMAMLVVGCSGSRPTEPKKVDDSYFKNRFGTFKPPAIRTQQE